MNYLKQNKNLEQTVDLVNYINDVLLDIAFEQDPLLIDVTLKKLATDYNLEYDMLKEKLQNITSNKNKAEKTEFKVENEIALKKQVKNNTYQVACKKLLFYMMNQIKQLVWPIF